MKRTLSFIVAFLMVFTVFAASDSVRVSAAGYQEWVLPTNWSSGAVEQYKGWDIAVQDVWSLLGFTDLDTATINSNADENIVEYSEMTTYTQATDKEKVPFPYVGANHNEQKAQNNPAVSKYSPTTWYVDYGGRWSPQIFEARADATGLDVTLHADTACAIVFTAPEDGTYCYSELVTCVLYETSVTKEPLSFTATVRKNGEILCTFTPTVELGSDFLQGEVELKAGDMLMFAFEQETEVAFSTNNTGDNNPDCLTVTGLSVWKGTPGGDEGGDDTGNGNNNSDSGNKNDGNKGDKDEKDDSNTVIIVACSVAGVAVVGAVVCAVVVAKRRKK